jgi:hypothetical protein
MIRRARRARIECGLSRRRRGPEPGHATPLELMTLRQLLRGTTGALALMLLSGVAVEYASGGAFHDTWWFRLAFLQLLVLVMINGVAWRALRRAGAASTARLLRGVAWSAWVMCALIGEVTVLMEVKPW